MINCYFKTCKQDVEWKGSAAGVDSQLQCDIVVYICLKKKKKANQKKNLKCYLLNIWQCKLHVSNVNMPMWCLCHVVCACCWNSRLWKPVKKFNTEEKKQHVECWSFRNTHPAFAALLFPVLRALVPAAGMPERDRSSNTFKSALQRPHIEDLTSYQHSCVQNCKRQRRSIIWRYKNLATWA